MSPPPPPPASVIALKSGITSRRRKRGQFPLVRLRPYDDTRSVSQCHRFGRGKLAVQTTITQKSGVINEEEEGEGGEVVIREMVLNKSD